MKYPIQSIYLDKSLFGGYETPLSDEFISNLTKINIFIGANNSGKSRLTRTLFENDNLGYLFKNIPINEINQIIEDFRQELTAFHDKHRLENYLGIKTEFLEKIKPIKYLTNGFSFESYLIRPLNVLQTDKGNGSLSTSSPMSSNRNLLGTELNRIGSKYLSLVDKLGISSFELSNFEKIYIPTLRGLRTVGINDGVFFHDDVYSRRTLKDYFNEKPEFEKKIFTGLRLYEDTKALLLGDTADRDKIKEFEYFLSKNFFNGQKINIIPRQGDDVVHVLIGDKELPIYKLGDGIQAIILLTYPLFFNKGKEMKIFIEEPEHYLHPGFQRVFLETLDKPEFSSFQYFITTHSNHFLDITLDIDCISIYTFRGGVVNGNQKFLIENAENEDANILELLGVRNASVFLSNCTVWVEGITDRIYIRKFLEVYQKSLAKEMKRFKEDIHYSFVEYGGGNITHWSFLDSSDSNHHNIAVERLCGKLFLISDKDGAGLKINGQPNFSKQTKYERHLELEKNLGNRYYCLVSREIENTLGPSVLKEVIKEYEAKKNPQNLVFNNFDYNKYKDQLIGSFINKQVQGITRSYAAKSGTINDKVNFAKKAVKYINSIEDMTEDAKEMTERIYNFIKENNS